MIDRVATKTDIERDAPTLKVLLADEFGETKETEACWLGDFIRWRAQGWLGTLSKFTTSIDIPTEGISVDIPETISQYLYGQYLYGQYLYEGLPVTSKILTISDAHSMVTDTPTATFSYHEPYQVYRKTEASTIEDDDEQSSSGLMQRELTSYVEDMIDHLFDSARELYFEDGMETDFSQDLISLVKKYENLAMGEISYLINYDRVDEEVASEALRWLARIDDASTYGWRLWLLEKSLLSKSPVVRDSAALGLLSMCDAHAIHHIQNAIERETITELRHDLQGALRELEVSLDAIAASGNKQS